MLLNFISFTSCIRVWYGLSTAVLSTPSLSTRTVHRQPVYRHDRFIETTILLTASLSTSGLSTRQFYQNYCFFHCSLATYQNTYPVDAIQT
jgi:hypothetical protein